MNNQLIKNYSYPIFLAFFLSLLYWTYLGLTTNMVIVHDAIGYEWLGDKMRGGLKEYLSYGQQREPFYPWLIAISMNVALNLHTHYQIIQRFLQLFLLFLTQIFTFLLCKKLKIRPRLTALTLLYLGFSPVLVNSALRLFSEIAVYPWVLTLILIGSHTWQGLHKTEHSYAHTFLTAALLGLNLTLLTFVKGLFQYVSALFLLPYLIKAILHLWRRNFSRFAHYLLVLATSLLMVNCAVTLYKRANLKYNGNDIFTERRAWALYGNTARRMEPLSGKKLLTGLSYACGSGFCIHLFGEEECRFWSYMKSDDLGVQKRQELQGRLPIEKAEKELIRLSMQKALENPIQYALLYLVEGIKMFFWEYSQAGLVAYPDWLEALFELPLVKVGLTTLMAVLSFLGFLLLLRFLWRRRHLISTDEIYSDQTSSILLNIFFILIPFMAINAFFFCDPRYSYPMGPIFIILIAFSLKMMLKRTP